MIYFSWRQTTTIHTLRDENTRRNADGQIHDAHEALGLRADRWPHKQPAISADNNHLPKCHTQHSAAQRCTARWHQKASRHEKAPEVSPKGSEKTLKKDIRHQFWSADATKTPPKRVQKYWKNKTYIYIYIYIYIFKQYVYYIYIYI